MKTLLLSSLLTLSSLSFAQTTPVFKTANYKDYQSVKSPLTQVALAKIKPEKVEDFKRVVNSLLPKMRAQPGNAGYTYSQNQQDPTEFVFYESWANGASIKNHMESPLIKEFFGVVGGYFQAGFPQLIILKAQGDHQ